MRTTVRILIAGAMFALATGAALGADAAVGTWKLNIGKSTFSPDPAPASQLRIYAESAQGLVLTIKTVTADGKQTTVSSTFRDDGKSYPISGSPDFDSIAVTRVDPLTTHSTQMKAGSTVSTGVRSVSKDGKTLTFSSKGTNAAGVKFDYTWVYDRQ